MSLSQEEKEQVAVLLGWKSNREPKCDDDPCLMCDTLTDIATESKLYEWDEVVTLEALMEYAKGKGWGHSLEWSEDEDAPEPGQFSYISLVMADWQGWRFRSPDPLAAMVRALLKAEEAAK